MQHSFSTLTEEQRRAVFHVEGPALVVAGAGSGKTKVVTHRVANLIEKGVDPASIVAVTFTNKAAGEMRERIESVVGHKVLVSTFHSLGAKILREKITPLGYPTDFVIYDERESEQTMKHVLRNLYGVFDEKELSYFQNEISRRKNSGSVETPAFKIDERIEVVFSSYQEALMRSRAVDFDDLIFLPLRLFSEYPDVLSHFQKRWEYVLVDEYQDANDCQSSLVVKLAGAKGNVFAVGDPDQSIYSWRGANIQHILKFQNQFPNAALFRLQQNFRSTSTILSAAHAVIEKNKKRIEKRLWSMNGEGEKIGCCVAQNEREEANFIGRSIRSLLEAGESADSIAVLYRTNAQSRSIEDALLFRNIPYRIVGGVSFYGRREVRDILAYLRLILHPHDQIAFERAATCPKRGLGASTLEKVTNCVIQENCSYLDFLRGVVQGDFPTFSCTGKQKEGFQGLLHGIQEAIQAVSENRLFDALSSLIRDTGYRDFLHSEEETFEERLENLNQLLVKAQEWEDEHPDESLVMFLEEVALDPLREGATDSQETVALMTVHNAKGLEFGFVFIVGLEEDLFPHINSKKEGNDIEEERRLFYVAMTRAKKRLWVSCSQIRLVWGGLRHMRPSRFLHEIPPHHLHPMKAR